MSFVDVLGGVLMLLQVGDVWAWALLGVLALFASLAGVITWLALTMPKRPLHDDRFRYAQHGDNDDLFKRHTSPLFSYLPYNIHNDD